MGFLLKLEKMPLEPLKNHDMTACAVDFVQRLVKHRYLIAGLIVSRPIGRGFTRDFANQKMERHLYSDIVRLYCTYYQYLSEPYHVVTCFFDQPC